MRPTTESPRNLIPNATAKQPTQTDTRTAPSPSSKAHTMLAIIQTRQGDIRLQDAFVRRSGEMILQFPVGLHGPRASFVLRITPAPDLDGEESVVGASIQALLERGHVADALQIRDVGCGIICMLVTVHMVPFAEGQA